MIREPRLTDSLLRHDDVLLRYDHESEKGDRRHLGAPKETLVQEQFFRQQLKKDLTLRHQPEPDHGEVVIEGEGEPNVCAFHDSEASCINGGELVQGVAPKVLPRLLKIA